MRESPKCVRWLRRRVATGLIMFSASLISYANDTKVDPDAPLLLKAEAAGKDLTDCHALNRVCLSIIPRSSTDAKPSAAPSVATATREEFFAECTRRNRVCVIKSR